MFNFNHYIPIIKWKRAEQYAIKELRQEHRKYITPLIQLVMPKYKIDAKLEDAVLDFEDQLSKIPEKIIDIWGTAPIFIDVSLLFTTPLKVKSIHDILLGGHKLKGTFIPVIYLNDDPKIKKAIFSVVEKTGSGLCVRLICPDFYNKENLDQNLLQLFSDSKLKENNIDLLIDIKETGNSDNKYIKYLDCSQNIPNLKKWRTFIFASGSFPEDLSKCDRNEENLIPRIDWKSWKEIISSNLERRPSFADYTIQHPAYKEISQFFPPTASIKYTLKDDWLIMKGRRQQFNNYLAHAAVLIKDNSRYYGEAFSSGDKYIYDKANHFLAYIKNPAIKGTGSTETWLRAGINHHLTLVADQIANLP